MPIPPNYTISPEHRVVRLTYYEPVTFPEWVTTMEAIIHDARFQRGFSFLVDRRNVPAPSPGFVESAAKYLREHEKEVGPAMRTATVVSDQLADTVSGLVGPLPGFENLHVFKSIEEAEEWLSQGVAGEVLSA